MCPRAVVEAPHFGGDAAPGVSTNRHRERTFTVAVCAAGLATLPAGLRRLHDYDAPPVRIGPALNTLAEELKGAHA